MDDSFFERENVTSTTECTGLIPSLPQDAEEDETEASLYAIHSAQNKGKKQCEEKAKGRRS